MQYQKLVIALNKSFEKIDQSSDIVFVCLGTDQISGDAFGPIVGHELKNKLNNVTVMGRINCPITYPKIEKIEQEIYANFKNPYIICIDAALSKTIEKGQIVVEEKATKIGRALGKKVKNIGNLSIKGVVGATQEDCSKNMETLINAPIELILEMAKMVTNGIADVYLSKNMGKI